MIFGGPEPSTPPGRLNDVRGRRMVFWFLPALAVMSCVPRASAGTAQPPAVVLHEESTDQAGLLGSYCWSYSTGDGHGTGFCADSTWGWPPAEEAARGAQAVIVIHRAERPKQVQLTAWRRIDPESGQPLGPSSNVDFVLRARLRDGRRVAWGARFMVPRVPGQYFLSMFGRWAPGDATYAFHLRLR